MDLKTIAIDGLKIAGLIAGTTVISYVSLKLAQKVYGPLEVRITEVKK